MLNSESGDPVNMPGGGGAADACPLLLEEAVRCHLSALSSKIIYHLVVTVSLIQGFEVMVGWQRHLQSLIRQVGRRSAEHNHIAHFSTTTTTTSRLDSSLLHGELPYLPRLWKLPSANVSTRPFYQLLQQSGISSSRKLLANSSEEQPVSSPFTPMLALESGNTEQKAVSKPENGSSSVEGHKNES
ncbi:hypothetical protein OIU79_028558 [Salix purpurea]|uniref:Uncharacterized protein n=1 Tax=Salix purpurea TaxID=77065 RepID=A0A9Q0VWS9_SALPP|nr:hypothetical protein OIU79_028558 [Salix purpurea]